MFLCNMTYLSLSSDLTEKLYNIPPEAVSRRLTKLLLSRFVLLTDSAVHKLVPNLLTPYKGSIC